MIVIILTISIFYALVITFLSITWYKDLKHNEDTDTRLLVLEKRINEVRKELISKIATQSCVVGTIFTQFEDIDKKVGKLEKRLPKNNK